MTIPLISAEQLARVFSDPDRIELSSDQSASDYTDARIIGTVREPAVEPDEEGKVPGKTACTWCGRSDPPGGLTPYDYHVTRTEHVDPETLHVTVHADVRQHRDPAGLHCVRDGDCQRARSEREPEWASNQYPGWHDIYARVSQKMAQTRAKINWAKTLEARQYAEQLAQQRRFPAPVPEYEWAQLADQFRPPPDFHDKLILALAARRREPEAVELAAEGEGIYGPSYDQGGPAPWAMLPGCGGPDGCTHDTLRCPRNRGHLFGHMRGQDSRVTDAATALARRAVS